MRRSQGGKYARFVRLFDRYELLLPVHRLLFWLLSVAGVIHVGLVLGHEPGFYSVAYLIGGAAESGMARLLLLGRRWRRWTGVVLAASLLAYTVSSFSGEPPDQVGLVTKLLEIAALWIVVSAPVDRRWRRVAGSTSMLALSVLVVLGAWGRRFQRSRGKPSPRRSLTAGNTDSGR